MWEYKRVVVANTTAKPHWTAQGYQDEINAKVEQTLNAYGAQGWELVSVTPDSGLVIGAAKTGAVVCFFKRQRGSQAEA